MSSTSSTFGNPAVYILQLPIIVALGSATYYLGENIYLSDSKREGTEYTTGTGSPASAAYMGCHDFVFPATILYAILYTFFLVKSRLQSLVLKAVLLCALFVLALVVLITSSRTSIFTKCILVSCTFASPSLEGKRFGGHDDYADDYNMPQSYRNSLAVTYFFTALIALFAIAWQIFAFFRNEWAAAENFDAIKSPLLGEAIQNQEDLPSTSREGADGAYRRIRQQQQQRRWFGVVTVMVFLLPIHILLTTRIGNNFQWYFPYEMAKWAAREITPDNNIGWIPQWRISPDIVLKLFPDVILFYSYIYLNALGGLLCALWPRSSLAKNMRRFDYSSFLNNGEILFWMGLATYTIGNFAYWFQVHGWEGNPIPAVTLAERFSRTIAQTALSLMGLAILPVARNNIFSQIFGLGWEAMLRFHRVTSRMFLLASLIHMFSFWVAFSEKNVWPQAIFGSPNGWIKDNETISIMSVLVIFFVIPLMGVFTLDTVRRQKFELFYFSHLLSAVLYGATLWHAASAWYFLLPGLALWAVDHALRFTKASQPISNVTLRAAEGGVTELSFVVQSNGGKAIQHEAGQFVFVHVPAVALLEFHPFTISSSPLDARSSCHIKAMGSGSFTDRLHRLAFAVERSGCEAPAVNIDGPYGISLAMEAQKCTDLLLIAGGIGITPLHSLLRTLILLASAPATGSAPRTASFSSMGAADWGLGWTLRRIRLVWSIRDQSLLELPLVHDTMKLIAAFRRSSYPEQPATLEVEVAVFCTAPQQQATKGQEIGLALQGLLPVTAGRPDLAREVSALATRSPKPLVLCCGPASMVQEAAAACRSCDSVDFRAETFVL